MRIPDRLEPANWRNVEAYQVGFVLYAHACFWEAHEVWEPVWLACAPATSERRLLAALIQLANAGLKLEMHQPSAAARLADEASAHLAEILPSFAPAEPLMGIDVARLLAGLDHFRSAPAPESLPAFTLQSGLDVPA